MVVCFHYWITREFLTITAKRNEYLWDSYKNMLVVNRNILNFGQVIFVSTVKIILRNSLNPITRLPYDFSYAIAVEAQMGLFKIWRRSLVRNQMICSLLYEIVSYLLLLSLQVDTNLKFMTKRIQFISTSFTIVASRADPTCILTWNSRPKNYNILDLL